MEKIERISGSMVVALERERENLQRQVDTLSTQVNTEIRAQTERRITALRESGFDFEKVFFNALFFDGIVLLARASLDIYAQLIGFKTWWTHVTTGELPHEDRLQAFMNSKGQPGNTISIGAYYERNPPYSECEVHEWLLWYNDQVPNWMKWSSDFISYVYGRCQGNPAGAGSETEALPITLSIAKYLLHDNLHLILLGGPALIAFREHRRVKELRE